MTGRFEAIKRAFTEAKRTGVPLKNKHIHWLILEVSCLETRITTLENEIEDYWKDQAGESI